MISIYAEAIDGESVECEVKFSVFTRFLKFQYLKFGPYQVWSGPGKKKQNTKLQHMWSGVVQFGPYQRIWWLGPDQTSYLCAFF